MRRTLKQLASELNVSAMTVSRALRGDPGVGEETRARIQGYAKQVNYSPNLVARSLVAKRTNVFGIIVPNLRHSFWLNIVIAVERHVRPAGYHVILTHSDDDPDRELSEIDSLVSRRVDALMLASCAPDGSAKALQRVEGSGVPVVIFDRYAEGSYAPGVFTGDVSGARTAVRHLVALGRKRIAHLAGDLRLSPARERVRGYLEVVAEAGLPQIIVEAGYGEESGYRAMSQLLDAHEADAVFAFHDYSAIGALHAAQDRGIRIPEDIAIVGYCNTDCAAHVPVPLTTIAQPTEDLGAALASLVLQRIGGGAVRDNVIIPTNLVVRRSCGAYGSNPCIGKVREQLEVH